MSFAEFEKSIGSIALKDLAGHWNDARGNRTMPAWSDLKPRQISKALPIIWAYTYDVKTDAFTGRLAGDRIVEAFGKSFRGLPLAAVQPPEWQKPLICPSLSPDSSATIQPIPK